jgi:hypothetical protein
MIVKKSEYSHTNLINELRITPKDFIIYLRMNEDTYLHLLSLIRLILQKQHLFCFDHDNLFA